MVETLDIISGKRSIHVSTLLELRQSFQSSVVIAGARNVIVVVVTDGKKSQEDGRLDVRLRDLRLALEDDADQVDDQVRELYSELLEEFREDPQALGKIRELGEDFATAVERGDLPRAMVMRGSSRKPS